ncbi:ABC transporter substrate-binding protein [Vandammella animalimorsus]|uniref:ABC transporter substrate-binding protein n=1 Tax=Vandammella animalimorsus TaxID=2029117 RepID=A0A2A2AX89_9BURK|nr:TRAP transporter substrate-binding protein DctP [Vandammella animalimorsus]RRD67626.1 ABC transporter substrate-binding protein [Comamonadaceae bacterium OH2310_COT-174]PAT31649.1 ABC transporter substrate-binding protein [Vandammella animalimorsus]PAT42269.1 ABC transporter substrate-binding protein [Vandammella animalimorsus]PAX16207.1 ABC transporter substrate-binding protein [Vandammella animalimorsus]PAX18236.1 ABC transporter substrate-binding protein [Vandammella animalimorsus]
MDRRSILKGAGIAGVLAAGVAPAVHAQSTVRWRLASSFPKSLTTLFGAAEKMAAEVKALSGGKFEISTHPAGELMPAFGVVDALQGDTIEIGQTAAYYFTGKSPIFAFSCAIPFGLTTLQMNAWKDHGNGRKYLDAFFEQYNFFTASSGNTGTQMGGWYRKEIKSVEDFKGLKMRLGGGLFGEAMAKLGVVAQNIPAGDIYTALEKGTLDAVEFVGPLDDEKLGLNKVAPYYYAPGWWEPSAELEFFVNLKKFNELSPEFKAILKAAMRVAAAETTSLYSAKSAGALKKLVAEKTQLKRFSKDILDAGFKASMEVFAEHEAKSEEFKKIYQDLRAFQRDQILWNMASEFPYNQYINSVKI